MNVASRRFIDSIRAPRKPQHRHVRVRALSKWMGRQSEV